MAEDTEILDQTETETQDGGTKPKPKLPGMEKSGSKPPLPGLAPEKKNDVVTTTGGGLVGGKVGDVPASGPSNSTVNKPSIPAINRIKTNDYKTNNLEDFTNQVEIKTSDGTPLKADAKGAMLDPNYVQGLQKRIDDNTLTDTDLITLSKSTKKSPEVVKAYINGGKQMGFAVESLEKEKNTNDELRSTITNFNNEYGKQYNPDDILSSPEKTAQFLQEYKQKSSEVNSKIFATQFNKTRAEAENMGYNDMNINNLKSVALGKVEDELTGLQNKFDTHRQLLNNHIVNQTIVEDKKNGVPQDQTIIKIAARTNPQGLAESFKGAMPQTYLPTTTPVAALGIAYDALFGVKDKQDLLNVVKGEAELQYNDAIGKMAINKISQGVVSGDNDLIQQGKKELDKVDEDVIYKYPSLVKQEIARRVSETLARESGQLEGSETDNLTLKIAGATPQDYQRVMKDLGYLDNPKTKDIAMSMVDQPELFSDASYTGGIKNSFLHPFKDLGLSILDISQFRNERDILSDKKKDELFPKELDNLKTSAKTVRTILNTTANLAGMATIAVATEGIGEGVGLSTKAAKSLGAYTSFGLPSYDGALKDSYNFLDNDAARTLYATITAVTNAEGGRLLDLGKITRIPGVSDVYAKMATGLTENTLTKEGLNELLGEAKNKYIDFAIKYGKNVTKGAATMAYFNISNNIEKLAFGDPNIKADEILPQAGTAFMDGVLGMSIMGSFGAVADMKAEKNTTYKGFIYNMALNHDATEDVFKQGLKDGTYTENEFNQKMQILNTAKSSKDLLDLAQQNNNVELNENQKSVYVANRTAEAVLRNKAEAKNISEDSKQKYTDQADRLQQQNKDVMDGLKFSPTLEPLYDLFDAEKKYNAALNEVNDGNGSYEKVEQAKGEYDNLINKYFSNQKEPETKQPEEKTFTDFDKTLFHEGKLTELGQEIKDRIAKGEDITILTARKDTPENRKFISETVGIPESNIKFGLDAEGKAAELTAHTGKKVFYDDNPDNVKAAQQTDARVVNTGLSPEQQIVMDNADAIKAPLYKNIIDKQPTAENADAILQEASDQWHDEGTREAAERNFPKPILDAAKKLYPQEIQESLSKDEKPVNEKAKTKLASFKEKHVKPESTELTPAETKDWNNLSMAEKLKLAKENLPEVDNLTDTEAAKVADTRAKELLAKNNASAEPIKQVVTQETPKGNDVVGREVVSKFPKPDKPISEMTADEINAHSRNVKDFYKNQEKEFFGVEGAKRYRELQSISNSIMASREDVKAADAEIKKMEEGLTKEQHDAFFGVNEKDDTYNYDLEELRDIARTVRTVEESENISELSRALKHPLLDFYKNSKDEGNLAVINAAKRKAIELGIDPKQLIEKSVKNIIKDLPDDNDKELLATSIIEQLLKPAEKTELPENKPLLNEEGKDTKETNTFKKIENSNNIDSLNPENKTDETTKDDTKSSEPVEAKEKPSDEAEPPEDSGTAAEGETDENGVRISKAGLKLQSNFSKDFEARGGAEVASGVMETLQERAEAKGISVQEQAATEVSQMKGRSVDPTEHNIITAGTHLLDIDKQLKKAIADNDPLNIERLTKLRDEANGVLRQLGNNAGRNLGLFNLVFNDARDSEISVVRDNLKRIVDVTDVPETIEELKKSNLSRGDKEKIQPYVAKIEQLKKERDGYIDKDGNRVEGYEEKTTKAISALDDAEVQKAIQEAHEAGKKEGMLISNDKPTREKKSKQLRDIASRLRTSDEMDKFLNRSGGFDIQKSGIDLGSYKEIVANIFDGIAKVVEAGENVSDFIKNAIEKVQDVDKDKLLRDVQMIMGKATLPKKEDVINDINKIAENESAQTITKTMVEKGLIKDVVNDIIHSDVPYDKVIETATEELKQHLPNVTKGDVADAYVRRNEFAPEKKSKLENTVREKSESVKRITNKEHRLAALEAGEDYHTAETKEEKQQVRSDYEQSVDRRIKELEKQKSDAKKQLAEPKTHSDRLQEAKDAVQERIDKIRTEIADRERTVAKEKLPLHEDVELGRLKEVEKALTSLRDKYLPEEPKMFADEKALKKRRVDLTNDISELNGQINKGERKEKNTSTVEDTDHIKTLREIKKQKQELLDKVAPDYEKIKRQTDKEAAELKKKISDIESETKYVNDSKKVFERTIVTPHTVNDQLKAAREERDKTYSENGLRVQKNVREPIRIEREYEEAVKKTNDTDTLTDKEKEDKLAELKQQRDLDLQGTHQGVLSHLADDVDALKKDNIEVANNSDVDTAKKLNDLNKKLDGITEGLQPTGENLEDMANKAYQKINDLLADKSIPKDVKEKLQQVKQDFENNIQLTADQLANKAIKKQWEREIKTAQTKINSGYFTTLPTTPYDFRRSIELSNLDRQRQNTTKRLNNLTVEAREKNKTLLDKVMDFSTKLLVSGVHTVAKVGEAAVFKPIMDSIVESTTGRLFNKLTDTPQTTFKEIKHAIKQYAAFKNKDAAEAYIKKLQDAKLAALENLNTVTETGTEAQIKKAEAEFKKADLAYGVSTLYHSIDANSLKTFWEYVAHGATDLDEQIGKGLKKNISDYRTKLAKTGYVLDGWIRTHGALKTSISARNEIMRSYASTLKYMQDKGMELNEQNLALAHLIAVNDFEYGRLSNKTQFSSLISKGKSHKSQAVRVLTKTLAPVSTIAINITKRGIDYSSLGAEGWVKLANAAKEGMRINEVEGKVYDTWMQKFADGIRQIPLQERKYINGVISRGLFGAGLSLATLYGLSTGNIKYGGTYDDKNKRKVYGADGELLGPDEWEFWGWKAPKVVNAFINHVPEMLPIALTSDVYEINKLDKKPAYLKTIFSEVQNRMPFMTLLGLINRPAETLEDRFTRIPLATEIEKSIDPKERENKTIGQKLKTNIGLGFLNPEKGSQGFDISTPHFKALKQFGITAPTEGGIDSYKVEKDETHPTGKMTTDEYKAFSDQRQQIIDEGLKNLYEKGIKLQRKDFRTLRIDLTQSKEDIDKILQENNISEDDFIEQLKNKKESIVTHANSKAKKVAVPNQTKTNKMTSIIPDN